MLDIHQTRRCPHGKVYDDYCFPCETAEAFMAVVEADRRLLTPQQQLWKAFEAGGMFVLNHVAPPKTEPPCFAHMNDGVFYVCRCPKCRAAQGKRDE
jgi:hypothetical protein